MRPSKDGLLGTVLTRVCWLDYALIPVCCPISSLTKSPFWASESWFSAGHQGKCLSSSVAVVTLVLNTQTRLISIVSFSFTVPTMRNDLIIPDFSWTTPALLDFIFAFVWVFLILKKLIWLGRWTCQNLSEWNGGSLLNWACLLCREKSAELLNSSIQSPWGPYGPGGSFNTV